MKAYNADARKRGIFINMQDSTISPSEKKVSDVPLVWHFLSLEKPSVFLPSILSGAVGASFSHFIGMN